MAGEDAAKSRNWKNYEQQYMQHISSRFPGHFSSFREFERARAAFRQMTQLEIVTPAPQM